MRNLKRLLPIVLLICCIAVVFSACSEEPYKDYVASGLEPKTKVATYNEKHSALWNSENELNLLTSYSAYKHFDIDLDLGYTKAYFEYNSLLIFLRTGCSSDNLKFVDVLENDGKLYPILECNENGPNDPITDDIIHYIFYVEIPNSSNYTIGEIINKTRIENVMQ